MTKEELIKQLEKDIAWASLTINAFDKKNKTQPEDFYYWLGRKTSYETALQYAKELT